VAWIVTCPPLVPLAVMIACASIVTSRCAWIAIVPPAVSVAFASTRPAIFALPPSAWIVILPALGPLAVMTLSASSVTSFFARSRISPFSPRTSVFARISPLLRITVPYTLTRPPSASTLPTFTASLSGAFSSTLSSGVRVSASSTVRPAAITTSPFGLVMTPLF